MRFICILTSFVVWSVRELSRLAQMDSNSSRSKTCSLYLGNIITNSEYLPHPRLTFIFSLIQKQWKKIKVEILAQSLAYSVIFFLLSSCDVRLS